ncbi:hypothetical protein D5086_030555 [Populus alba]|uniref:Uncharacterized protein n=1 Tax=Populus alba TaxID=43335 RepID=A0ACC4APG6_POPAL
MGMGQFASNSANVLCELYIFPQKVTSTLSFAMLQEFRNTTVNSDLHFISWDNPPKQHPHHLNLADMQRMIDSNAPFARKFPQDDPVLDKIDSELLSRGPGMFTPGGWCVGSRENGTDPCSAIGNITVLRPGPGAKRLETLITTLLSNENFRPRQCK